MKTILETFKNSERLERNVETEIPKMRIYHLCIFGPQIYILFFCFLGIVWGILIKLCVDSVCFRISKSTISTLAKIEDYNWIIPLCMLSLKTISYIDANSNTSESFPRVLFNYICLRTNELRPKATKIYPNTMGWCMCTTGDRDPCNELQIHSISLQPSPAVLPSNLLTNYSLKYSYS